MTGFVKPGWNPRKRRDPAPMRAPVSSPAPAPAPAPEPKKAARRKGAK